MRHRQRDRFRPVAALAGAEGGRDDAGREVDAADDVVLRVGDVERPVRRMGEPLGPRERRLPRRAAVTAVPLLAGAGDVVNGLPFQIDAVDGVALRAMRGRGCRPGRVPSRAGR